MFSTKVFTYLNKSAAFGCRFVQTCLTFLWTICPNRLLGLCISFISSCFLFPVEGGVKILKAGWAWKTLGLKRGTKLGWGRGYFCWGESESVLHNMPCPQPPPPPHFIKRGIEFVIFGNKGEDEIFFLERVGLD